METTLIEFHDALKALRRALKAAESPQVGKKSIREEASRLGKQWLNDITRELATKHTIAAETLEKYSALCTRLINLSAPNNRKNSYVTTLDALIKPMRSELIVPLQAGATRKAPSAFEAFVASLRDPGESAYFQEALNCAKEGFLRAAAVMGWCAAIDRIHRKIEQIGFTQFNVASDQMARQQKGRFRRFNQTQNVTTLSDLRGVFDTTVLWVLEGLTLIDSNQHTRLRSCFEMRSQCAHPGDAPITEYNLMSFFSDIQQIVLENMAFEL
jgi:hypothetical protein